MSHFNIAQIKADIIRLEEQFKAAIERLEKYQLREELKQKMLQSLNIADVYKQIQNLKSSQNYTKIQDISRQINNFFNGIENYVMLSFDLDKKDYNETVSDLFTLWSEKNKGILAELLSETEDELLKNYILMVYKNNPHISKETILVQSTELMKDSLRNKKKHVQKNFQKIIEIKNLKHSNISDDQDNPAKQLSAVNNTAIEQKVEKAVRNRVLTAIIKIIKEQGFIVNKENVVEKGNHAVINTIKPNGEAARFEVYLDGRFQYKFHEYVGLSCEKDIENFEKKFESIYGVKIEDKKTIWSNPDKLKNQAHNVINNKKIGG